MTSTEQTTRGTTADAVRRERTEQLLVLAATAPSVERDVLLNEVVEINLRVADAVARRFQGRGVPLDDLGQVAALALVGAARRFDPAQERDFLSYAVPTMSGEIKRYFRDRGWAIRPPRRIQEIQSRATDLHLNGRADRTTMTPAEIADELDVPVSDVHEALAGKGLFQPGSLDAVATGASDEGKLTVAELLPAEDHETERCEARMLLEPVLRRLSERDRRILHLRFHEEQTQSEIGEDLGVTQMQVSRLLNRILNTMREELAGAVV